MKLLRSSSLLIIICWLATNTGIAQTREIDGLQNLLKTAKDTTEVNIMRFLGQRLRSHDNEKALKYLLQSVEKSKQIGFGLGEMRGLYSIGVTYGMTGSYSESLEYLKKCLVLANEYADYPMVTYIYNSMGIVYKSIGDYPTSQGYYLKRIQLVDSLQLDLDNSTPYINLGVLYDLTGEEDKAIESYERALEVYSGEDRESLENDVMTNLARIDFSKNNYQAALDKLLKVKDYRKKQNNNIELCNNYAQIGNCYLELEQWALAQEYLQKSLDLAEQLSIKQHISTAYFGLANLMFRLKRFQEAVYYTTKNLEALDNTGGYEQKRDAHELAHKVYMATGQLPKSIYHLEQTMAYRDSLLNETKIRDIQNLQIQHEVYLKDKEIKQNELQLDLLNTRVTLNNKRLVYLAIIAVLLLFSAALLYIGYWNKKKSNKVLQQKNALISEQKEVIEDMNTQLEKRMLRAQMNPHFIFNSLSSIQHLITSGNKKAALIYLNKFSKLMRQVLETSITVNLVLHEEIELLKIYVELEALRFDNSFSYTFKIDKDLDLYRYEVPMLLVQPYLENAILHGLLPKEGEKNLTISFRDEQDSIVCIVEDNGVGFGAASTHGSSEKVSRGMSITAQRIQGMSKFTAQELVNVEHLSQYGQTGTRVTIRIPKEQ